MNFINTDGVAIYAAFVATVALAWRIFEWMRERPKIKVKIGYAQDFVLAGDPSFVIVAALNTGNHPITICAAGIHISGLRGDFKEMDIFESEEFKSKNFPRRLNEGERLEKSYECKELKKTLKEMGIQTHLEFAWFRDATDRIYRAKFSKAMIRRILN